MQRNAAEQIGMNVTKTPAVHEQVDHAGSGRAGSGGRIGSRLDNDPRGFEILLDVRSGFDDGPRQWAAFVQVKAQGSVHRAFNAVDTDLAIALRSVRIADRKKSAVVQNGEVKSGAAAKLANVHVSAENSRRTRAELAVCIWRNAHDSAERPKRNDGRSQRPADFATQFPQKEERIRESLLQKSQAFDDARPSPALVCHLENVD